MNPTEASLLDKETRVLLIGGSSHSGKTTAAELLAARLGWELISTDRMARHPGRPWPSGASPVPPHVASHYLGLPDEALLASVLGHYRDLWPAIEDLVRRRAGDLATRRLVLEGSALWPESVAALPLPRVSAIWLTATDDVFTARIYAGSRYADADAQEKTLADRFLARTLRFDRAMMADIKALGLPFIDVTHAAGADELTARCLRAARSLV